MSRQKQDYLKKIPAVNELLETDKGEKLVKEHTHDLVVEGIRKVNDRLRNKILNTDLKELEEEKKVVSEVEILNQVSDYLAEKSSNNLVSAINATGVVVHTNLGRSLLSDAAQDKLQDLAAGYSTLEIDRKTGERGSRYELVEDLLTDLTGAEAGLVVNNNAAAVLLVLAALCKDQAAVIARGQLVEIGGSFRIPEVMKQSGAELMEIGTTNRVHLSDYKNAINENTGMLLKVHTSNYRVEGFSKEISLSELVELGSEAEVPVVEDLGSGILVDLTPWGLSYEPTVQDSISAGADVVTFSGDKLLGGPQAGIIVGKEKYIEQMKNHQLNRALRVDKFTLGALEATLQEYRDLEQAKEEIPTLKMLKIQPDELKEKAERLIDKLEKVVDSEIELKVRTDSSKAGGGAFPVEELSTYVVELTPKEISAEKLAENLRLNNPPIFTRITEGTVLIDVRTLQSGDISDITAAVEKL